MRIRFWVSKRRHRPLCSGFGSGVCADRPPRAIHADKFYYSVATRLKEAETV